MAKGSDRVYVIKREYVSQGGNVADQVPLDCVIEPTEDAITSAGVLLVDATTTENDDTVFIERDDNLIKVKDHSFTQNFTLFDVLKFQEPGFQELEQDLQFNPTKISLYKDQTKSIKYQETSYLYLDGLLSTAFSRYYNHLGVEKKVLEHDITLSSSKDILSIDTNNSSFSSFSPTSVATLKLFLRSDLGLNVSGVNVTSWIDQVTGASFTPQGGTVTAVTVSGKTYVQCSDTGSSVGPYLSNTAFPTTMPSGVQPWHVFLRCRLIGNWTSRHLFQLNFGASSYFMGVHPYNILPAATSKAFSTYLEAYYDAWGKLIDGVPNNETVTIELSFDGIDLRSYIEGKQAPVIFSVNVAPTNYGSNTPRIFISNFSQSNTAQAPAQHGAILFYQGIIDEMNRGRIRNFLDRTWP